MDSLKEKKSEVTREVRVGSRGGGQLSAKREDVILGNTDEGL